MFILLDDPRRGSSAALSRVASRASVARGSARQARTTPASPASVGELGLPRRPLRSGAYAPRPERVRRSAGGSDGHGRRWLGLARECLLSPPAAGSCESADGHPPPGMHGNWHDDFDEGVVSDRLEAAVDLCDGWRKHQGGSYGRGEDAHENTNQTVCESSFRPVTGRLLMMA